MASQLNTSLPDSHILLELLAPMGKGGQSECAHHAETICTTMYAETMYIRTCLHLLEMAGEAGVGIIVRYKYDEKLFRRYTGNACERIRSK